MAWIELHQSLTNNHRKVVLLADRLDMEEPHVIGHLVCLWTWALDNAPQGILPASKRLVVRGAQYCGDTDHFFTAMVEVGFIDESLDGYILHDWYEYAGKLIERRASNAVRMRNARATNVLDTCNARAEHVSSTCADAPVFSAELPNQTKPNQPTNIPSGEGYTDGFESFWQAYPRRVEKRSAFKAWNSLQKLPASVKPTEDDLIAAAAHYADECVAEKRDPRYVKHPASFLSGTTRPYEEYVTKRKAATPADAYNPKDDPNNYYRGRYHVGGFTQSHKDQVDFEIREEEELRAKKAVTA